LAHSCGVKQVSSADALPGGLYGSLGSAPQQGLELCEDLLDRIEVGAVWRQEEQLCADGPDGASDGLSLVTAEIVDDDNVAGSERLNQHLLDVGEEAFAPQAARAM